MNELWALRNTAFQKTINVETPRPSDKDIIHNLILSRLPTHDQPLAKAAAHHFNNPGKMLRATMAMRGAHVLNVNRAAATRWAAAVAQRIFDSR
jgi:geranylgeranyl pyrophosphate synthase